MPLLYTGIWATMDGSRADACGEIYQLLARVSNAGWLACTHPVFWRETAWSQGRSRRRGLCARVDFRGLRGGRVREGYFEDAANSASPAGRCAGATPAGPSRATPSQAIWGVRLILRTSACMRMLECACVRACMHA